MIKRLQVAMIFEKDDITTSQWHYYIPSRKLTTKELFHHARLECRIESMHWLLDVYFAEDKTKVREVQKNLCMMRKIALNLVKQYQLLLEKHFPVSIILQANSFDINH